MKKQCLFPAIVSLLMAVVPVTAAAQESFIAEVKLFAGNFAPKGWAFCEGQLLPINQNQALFSLLGTTYGGDGRTTFALPDLRGRVPVGVGQGPGLAAVTDGQKQGAENITLTANQLPAHEHALRNVTETDIKNSPGGGNNNNSETKKVLAPVAAAGSTTAGTKPAGSSQPVSIKPPSLGMRYIICLQGIFPSRN